MNNINRIEVAILNTQALLLKNFLIINYAKKLHNLKNNNSILINYFFFKTVLMQ